MYPTITMSNEVKIGILTIVAIALSLWGYKFILGQNILVKSNTLKVYYEEVDGLILGTPVQISGVKIGSVSKVEYIPKPEEKVLVVLDLNKGIKIPKDSKAVIVSTGFMGGKAIDLEYGTPCTAPNCAKSGDFIEGETKGLLGSMVGADNMQIYMDILVEGLKEAVSSIGSSTTGDSTLLGETLNNLNATMANLESATGKLDNLLSRSSSNIDGTLANLNSLTGTLDSKKEQIASIIENFDSLSNQLAHAELGETLTEFKAVVTELKNTLQSANKAMAGVDTAMTNINNGEGTLGKLMKDEGLYQKLESMILQADSLMVDIEERPYRYMPFKSRKKVKRFEAKDDKQRGN